MTNKRKDRLKRACESRLMKSW